MQFLQKHKVLIGFALALLFIGLNTFVSYRSLNFVIANNSALRHSYETMDEMQALFSTLQDVESGLRGYLITERENYLDPYYAAVKKLDTHFDRLRVLIDNENTQKLLPELETHIRRRVEISNDAVAMRRRGDETGLRRAISIGAGKVEMDRVRQLYDRMKSNELSVLYQRDLEASNGTRSARLALSLAALANFLLLGFVYYMIASDMARRQRSEMAMQRARDLAENANQAKSLFLANMSHELRTPLNAILGYSEILLEDAKEYKQDSLITDLNNINGAGHNLLALINDLLDLSKAEAGKIELYLEEFNVAEMVEETVATAHPLMTRNNNNVHVEYADGLGTMTADCTKVRQCLLNLLSNAAKFTDGGDIVVLAERERSAGKDWILLSVRDTGIGISEQQMEKLFQPFMQADASTTRKYGGTGLGLSLTRRFCRLMDGDVTAVSIPGQGSTFTMKLPAQVESKTTTIHNEKSVPALQEQA